MIANFIYKEMISRDVYHMSNDIMHMSKVTARWVPRFLNEEK
jgi:hypothetical protein